MRYIFIVFFLLMVIQSALTAFQIKAYQRTIRELKGSGILGIGFKRSMFRPGEIIVLSYSRADKKVYKCRRLKGSTVFQRFKDVKDYEGITLEEIREIGIGLDAQVNKRLRKKEPYNPAVPDKKKGALIQAVEAIDNRLRSEAA